MIDEEGLTWLDALAERYEATARQLRETAASIRALSVSSVPRVGMSEAVRMVLGQAGTPRTASEIWASIHDDGIPLETQSRNPRNLLNATLAKMHGNGQLKFEEGTEGSDGRWSLA